jgi:hypothetical protein
MFLFWVAYDWIAYPFVRRAMDQRTSFAALMMVLFHFPAALETVVSAFRTGLHIHLCDVQWINALHSLRS